MSIIRFEENVRGAEIFASGRCNDLIARGGKFSVMIYGGKGEVFFKKVDGVWHQSVMSVDRCFGVMKSRWSKV